MRFNAVILNMKRLSVFISSQTVEIVNRELLPCQHPWERAVWPRRFRLCLQRYHRTIPPKSGIIEAPYVGIFNELCSFHTKAGIATKTLRARRHLNTQTG